MTDEECYDIVKHLIWLRAIGLRETNNIMWLII